MATLTTLTAAVRRQIGEQSTGFISDADITAWLNEAQRDFQNYGATTEGSRGIALSANKNRYDLPSDCIPHKLAHVTLIRSDREAKLQEVPIRTLHNILGKRPSETGRPEFWYIWDEKFHVYRTPSASWGASSTTLNGALTSGATTITVADVSGFPKQGWVTVGTEEIYYQNTNSTNNQFLNCVRGEANTTAAAHASGATLTELNLRVWYYRTSTDLSAGTDTPTVRSEYHDALVYYAAGRAMEKSKERGEAQAFLGQYYQYRQKAEKELRKRQRDRNPRIFPGDRGYRTVIGTP